MVCATKIVDARVTVETPEGVDFQYVVAGPGKRGTAYAFDFLLRAGMVAVAGLFGFLLGFTLGIPTGSTLAMLLVAWFGTTWLYGALFESLMRGQTPGKRMMRLRVLRTNGTPVGWFEAFGRNLLLGADGWILIGLNPVLGFRLNTVALISMCTTSRMQRLGDILFDTMVVDETREYVRRPAGLTASVDVIPREECSGRYHVPERSLAVIERLFEGDRDIAALRREEIARPLANALRTRIGWEEPAPDPFNPHPVMEQMPHRHTQFLRRLLKTFAEEPTANSPAADRTSSDDGDRSPAHRGFTLGSPPDAAAADTISIPGRLQESP
ncbi:MAG: RDD family protein [Planctomycetaceae bacterium]|jgi:uncharacterized RDD family membrane protein YckC